ncbi:hypothetical protein TW65_71786 [Stemphylium lycopersici]|uniref:Uncharacterized protein n=1 Tax=Stemphylium lycopersici TaxID=183478 RepID=A0A364MS49_STELY|nr:hypothetical protein TW65_71786 [Stemphylium lycopersici]RAR01739.1 hypothetical protein DDE83_008808 [Stemphylium lycopersici]
MDHDIPHADLSPEELKAAIGATFSRITQDSSELRLEQACKGGQVMAIKIPTVAQEYLDATSNNSRFVAYTTQHSQAVKDFMNGSGIRDDIRKGLCYGLKRMDAGLKPIPKWRRLVKKHTLPRVERRAAATFFSFCEELKERGERVWASLRERLGPDAVAEEDEGMCEEDDDEHHCGHPGSDSDAHKPLFTSHLKDMLQKLKVSRTISEGLTVLFPKLPAAFARLEKAYELIEPELNIVQDYCRKFRGNPNREKGLAGLLLGLEAVHVEQTSAKRNLEKEKELASRKLISRGQRSLIAKFDEAVCLLDAIYAHDLMRLEAAVSNMFYGGCECPHAIPDVNIAYESRSSVIAESVLLQNTIKSVDALSQSSEHAQFGKFSSAASEVYQAVGTFLKFREEHRIALQVEGNTHVKNDDPQFEKSWSVMTGYERLLLELLHAYQALLATYHEIQEKAAMPSSEEEPGPAKINSCQMILSEMFTYLAGMRGLFSESLVLRLLQCRKSSNYMQNPSEMMLLTPNLFIIWDDCRDKIHTQHSALAKFSFNAINGGQPESHGHVSNEATVFQRFLVSQKLTKERMSCPSICAVEYRYQLETQIDALKAYADMCAEDEIAQEVTRYLDQHTKPVTQVMRHFETLVQVAQCEEPV